MVYMAVSIIKEYTVYRTEINSYGTLKKPLCKFFNHQSATDYMNGLAAYNIDSEEYTREDKNTPDEITLNKMGIKLVYKIESLDVDINSLKDALKVTMDESDGTT